MSATVRVATRNRAKIEAVTCAFGLYPELMGDRLIVLALPVEELDSLDEIAGRVGSNPTGYHQIMEGAAERAELAADVGVTYGVGLESGVITATDAFGLKLTFNVSVAAIRHRDMTHFGMSPAFPVPPKAAKDIAMGGELGALPHIFGAGGKDRDGVIGPLTKGRVTRAEFDRLAVVMALCPIVSADLYGR